MATGSPRRNRRFHAVRGPLGARLFIAVGGIAVCTVLALVLIASDRGVTADIRAYIAQPGADLWVAPRGVDNFIRSAGLISGNTTLALGEVEGVEKAAPLLRAFVTVKSPGNDQLPRGLNLMAVGYDPDLGLGGPPRLVAGEPPRGEQVALDQAAAHRLGVGVGDEVAVNERTMTVSALTGGTNLIATQFAFFELEAVRKASGFVGSHSSFVLVDVAEGEDAEVVRERIDAHFTDASAHPVQTFLENNLTEAMAGFDPFSRLVTGVGLAAAAALVAMLMQGIVEERKREVAVLLAMGAPLRAIVGDLVLVALLVSMAGVALGTGVAFALTSATARWSPVLTLQLQPQDPLLALLLFAVVALAGAWLPLMRLRNIDPVESFRP